MNKKVVIIGSGFSGLSMGCLLQKQGWQVTILEKNSDLGGRARQWKHKGYTFDMGPSWYLMPEVFDRFFAEFGAKTEDFYTLSPLNNQYKVFYEEHAPVTITNDLRQTRALFDQLEPDGGARLDRYLADARFKYETAMGGFLYRDYRHLGDFFQPQLIKAALRLGIFSSLSRHTRRYFQSIEARQILEYAMVFLGNSPQNAPSLYSIMSHIDLNLGVQFPQGGIFAVVQGLNRLFCDLGGLVLFDQEVKDLTIKNDRITGVKTDQGDFAADLVVNSADYAWAELELLPYEYRSYSANWWNSRTLAPSMFLALLGVNKKIAPLEHHNLYFARDWERHFEKIFKKPAWPDNPCFYLSAITKTDPLMAPPGCENLFLLIPAAPGLPDGDEFRQGYLREMLSHVEQRTGTRFQDNLDVCRIYGPSDFKKDYHAFRGTALGLAHTLFQTAVFRPSHRSKKLSNLFHTGQYTHPGVGVPMTLIASQVCAGEIQRSWSGESLRNSKKYF